MKALKVIGILLLVIVGIGLIASLVLPKEMEVSESVTIEAPMDVVWNHVKDWKVSDQWSPWKKEDPDMKVTFEGEDGAVGSKFSWEGNDQVGSGYQEITAVDMEAHQIASTVHFIEPMEGQGDITLTVNDEGEGKTKVTWVYNQQNGIPMNLMATIFNAKGMISGKYQEGLAQLKEIAEKAAAEAAAKPTFEVLRENRAAMNYVIKKEVVKMADMKTYFDANMPAVGQAVGMDNFAGAPCALYWSWDEEKGESELSAAIPVKAEMKAPEGYTITTIDAGDCLVIDYWGSYDGLGGAHEAMDEYMTANNITYRGPVLEEYLTDPSTEQDPAKWHTKIVYPIQAAAAPTE